MPTTHERYETTGEAARVQNDQGDNERAARAKAIGYLWRYYDGDHMLPLKANKDMTNNSVLHNLVALALDRAVEFIDVPDRYTLPGVDRLQQIGDDMVPVIDQTQEALDALYDAHREVFREIVQAGLLTGHVYLKLMPIERPGELPRAELIDPAMVTVYTSARNPRRVVFYRLQWVIGDVAYRQDIVPDWALAGAPPTPESGWQVIDYEQKHGRDFREVARDSWPWAFPPLVEWRNKMRAFQYYGASEYTFAPRANDVVNFLESNTAKIIKFHASPRTFLTGAKMGDVVESSIEGVWTLPGGASVDTLEMQGDLSSSLAFTQQKINDFFAACRVVDLSSVKDRIGQITNFGVRMLYNEMLNMGEEKRRVYGRGFADALQRLMIISGIAIAEPPSAEWPDPLPVNRLEVLQGAQLEQGLGITSKETLAEQIGRDYESEQEKRREEQATAGELLNDVLTGIGETGGLAAGFGANGSRPPRDERA